MPVPRGGGVKLVEALVGIVRDAAGRARRDATSSAIVVSEGRATGVRTADGEEIDGDARRARERDAAAALRRGCSAAQGRSRPRRGVFASAAARCRSTSRCPSRRSGMATSVSARTAIVHLTPGLDGVSRAVNEAERGLLPAEATIVVGQPMAVDPSRAPEGRWILWIQLQEVPSRPKGDAAGEIDTGDGTWTEELRERYADRIQARIARPRAEPRVGDAEARRALARGHRGREHRTCVGGDIYARLVRARPEPALAPAAGAARAPHTCRRASGTSARARIPAPGSAPAPARSSRRSSCGRASPSGSAY